MKKQYQEESEDDWVTIRIKYSTRNKINMIKGMMGLLNYNDALDSVLNEKIKGMVDEIKEEDIN